MSTITIKTSVSSNLKSAQSKKCRLLKDVRSKAMHVKVAKAILSADPMLQTILTPENIDDAASGKLVGRSRGASITITVELDEPKPVDKK